MQYLKTIKVILTLAALLFIAKPFLGFNALTQLQHSDAKLILVKAFAKRKPEFLEDSEKEKSALHYKIAYPPQTRILSIAALLCLLFPFIFSANKFQTGFFSVNYYPPTHNKTYLLTGQLII